MKKTFFKIFELPTHQVLITKDFDEDSTPTVVISFFLDGVKLTQTMGFDTEKKRDIAFDSITESELQQILDGAIVHFAELEN